MRAGLIVRVLLIISSLLWVLIIGLHDNMGSLIDAWLLLALIYVLPSLVFAPLNWKPRFFAITATMAGLIFALQSCSVVYYLFDKNYISSAMFMYASPFFCLFIILCGSILRHILQGRFPIKTNQNRIQS